MREILTGIWHWATFHEGIQSKVHSYYVDATHPAVLIDPRVPKEGLAWWHGRPGPKDVYLTNRHHYRHSQDFAAAFGATVWCHEKGLHEFTHGEKVRAFQHGQTLPGGVLALRIGALCDEETAFYLPVGGGVVAFGDSLVNQHGHLGFVPDELMGDDPATVKRGLVEAFRGVLAGRRFSHLLMAHGAPVIGRGREALERVVAEQS